MLRRLSIGPAIAVLLCGLGAGVPAIAAGPDAPVEPKVAIQRAKFQMAHELALSFGVMPLDPFQKGICGSLSYTIHFSRYFAWELFRATAAHLTSTSLRNQLLDTFAVSPDDFNAPRFMATTGFELSPIYGKQVFLNNTVVHQGLFVGLYGGVIFGDRRDNRTGDWLYSSTLSDLRPTAGGGVGYRLFLSKGVSLRIDVRDFISFRRAITDRDKTQLENVLYLGGGIAFNFWRDDA